MFLAQGSASTVSFEFADMCMNRCMLVCKFVCYYSLEYMDLNICMPTNFRYEYSLWYEGFRKMFLLPRVSYI